MPFTAAEVMKPASVTLNDAGAVRWTAQELHGYLNDGLRAVVERKPNAASEVVSLNLVAGTVQTLPEAYTVLSRVNRNLVGAGSVIRKMDRRETMDALIPGWQSSAALPFAAQVSHVIHDLANPRVFYVVPGNIGTGQIEAVVGVLPEPVPEGATPADIGTYEGEVPLHPIYQNALTNYVLYRAFSKDAGLPNAAARAEHHLAAFSEAISNIGGAEAGMALATAGRPKE